LGALKGHGIACLSVDANLEGLLEILNRPSDQGRKDTWTRRALSRRSENLSLLMNPETYGSMGRYTRAVADLNRVLDMKAAPFRTRLSLHNFQQEGLSPVKSGDLVRSAEQPEENVFHTYFEKKLTTLLEQHTPRFMGFSVNYLSQALTAFAMIGLVKRLDPGLRVILGGGLITSWMRRPGRPPAFPGLVDELVDGPGEERLLDILGSKLSGEDPLPCYDPFRDLAYLSPARVLPFSASTGCYWGRCSFCPEKAEGNRYTCRLARSVPSSLQTLAGRYGPGLIHLCDNALSPALLKALADSETGIPWYGFSRFIPQLADPGFCRALKRSGCIMLKLGLESGDQKVLDDLGKGITVEEAGKALQALSEAGIGTYVYLLFGTPAEDEAAAGRTLGFTAENHEFIDFLNISIFNLPRDCNGSSGLRTYDFSKGDLSLYQGFIHPKAWDRNRVRQFLDKQFKRHPAVAEIVRRDPPVFTSNHAPFFIMKRGL
jgi:hypothetical protein